jgi:hypothetical protein
MLAVLLVACGSVAEPEARPAAPPARQVSPAADRAVAETERFAFYSRFDFNLHDRLRTWSVENVRSGEDCITRLPAADRERWNRAVDRFDEILAQGRVELRVRYALFDPSLALDENLGAVPPEYLAALAGGAAAYRACFWAEDDRTNRAWIAALVPLLHRAEAVMASRIAAAHASEWPGEKLVVDVVPYVNFGGGSTVVFPHHVLISSTQPGYDGYGGLELVFHEGSHTFVSPRSDGSIAALAAAAEARGVELPRDLWHAILFLTAGHVTRRTVRELWNDEYEPYMNSQGVLDRAWPEMRAPLEAHWIPYLDGQTTLREASEALVAVLSPR